MANRKLVTFIKEARKRGFSDKKIKNSLIDHNWPLEKIEEAFASIRPRAKYKNKVTLYLDSEILKALNSRAKKNHFNLPEQIEDILRRSVVSSKRTSKFPNEKLDDKLVGIFSRRQRKSKKKKKK